MAITQSSNPVLSDRALRRSADQHQPGWAAPGAGAGRAVLGQRHLDAPPGGPLTEPMTMGGVITASATLLAILAAFAALGWFQVDQTTRLNPLTNTVENTTSFPGWVFVVGLASIVLAIVTAFKATWARITAPIYAAGIGVFLGAISAVYNYSFDGIVLQAVMLTGAVFLAMLFLYATRIIKVTRRLAIGIVAATFAVLVVYLATALLWFVSGSRPLIYDSGPLGIGISLLIVGIAAFNFLLDFDFIERGVKAGLPKGMEWYAAFGLLVTLVWLYLEMLRLLAKLRQ